MFNSCAKPLTKQTISQDNSSLCDQRKKTGIYLSLVLRVACFSSAHHAFDILRLFCALVFLSRHTLGRRGRYSFCRTCLFNSSLFSLVGCQSVFIPLTNEFCYVKTRERLRQHFPNLYGSDKHFDTSYDELLVLTTFLSSIMRQNHPAEGVTYILLDTHQRLSLS